MTEPQALGWQSDNTLMEQVREGDSRKLAMLFERHHEALFRYFLRMTGDRPYSEDMVQEVFFRVLKYRGTYRQEAQFTTWMYRIARNAHIDNLRRRKWEVPMEEDWDAPGPPAESPEKRQEAEVVRRALLAIPEDKRELLIMTRYQEMKYEQIAEVLGVEVGTVKVRIHRALRSLRETYQAMGGGRKP